MQSTIRNLRYAINAVPSTRCDLICALQFMLRNPFDSILCYSSMQAMIRKLIHVLQSMRCFANLRYAIYAMQSML
jgi:hypothetical protein